MEQNTNIMDIASQEVSEEMATNIENLNEARIENATSAAVTGSGISKITEEQIARWMAARVQKVRKYKVNRNDPCPCGSGKKYKNCCLSSGKYEELVPVNDIK